MTNNRLSKYLHENTPQYFYSKTDAAPQLRAFWKLWVYLSDTDKAALNKLNTLVFHRDGVNKLTQKRRTAQNIQTHSNSIVL